jgi:broad specificity phosphatase PhoE
MGQLFLVRHGQASFGAADYDQLSPLGVQQSRRLGEFWRSKDMHFDAVLTGTLKRHAQTWQGIAQGANYAHTPILWPGLNEYDSEAVIAAIHPEPLQKATSPEEVRQHFRLLRQGLTRWMQGATQPAGMPTYPEFVQGVASALDHVRQNFEGRVLIVSSGGPIATAVGQVLGLAPEVSIELNLHIRNSSVSEFNFNPKRHSLLTYNTLPHLGENEHAAMITYA